jgi:ankyrin repeat protein
MIATVNNYIGIKELLENDPTIINEVNNKNENGLIIAAKINQVKAVEMLLKRGIYVNHQDNLGNTALHYAVEIQEPYLVSQLMTKNPDIHIKNNEGKSPLDLAHEISEDNDNSKNIKKEILEILTNPSYKLKNIKFNSQSTNKYKEEIQKYITPYANNYYPEYSSRSSMESDKKLIYKRNETKGMSTKFILFEVGEFLLRFGIIILVIYLLKFLF